MSARALALTLVVAACRPDYVHVIVDSTSPEITGQSRMVSVRAYGGAYSLEAEHPSNFHRNGPFYQTDFNLVFEDGAPDTIDLRVAVLDVPGDWAGSALVRRSSGGDLHVLLSPGERPLGARGVTVSETTGELVSMTRFGTGFAMAWPESAGVRLVTVDDPELFVGQPDFIADIGAHQLRLASRPTSFDPDLFALSWIRDDRTAKLRIRTTGSTEAPTLTLVATKDIWPAVAPADARFAVATVTQTVDNRIALACYDQRGAVLGRTDLGVEATGIRGFVVGSDDKLIIAFETESGGLLVQVTPTLAEPACSGVTEVSRNIANVHAVAMSAGGDLVLTVQRDGEVFVQSYALTELTETNEMKQHGDRETIATAGSAATLTPYQQLAISSCAVVWPAQRDDDASTRAIDLWARDLDSQGRPRGQARVVNGRFERNHFAPTVACLAPMAFATFLSGNEDGREIAVRQLPAAPKGEPPGGAQRE